MIEGAIQKFRMFSQEKEKLLSLPMLLTYFRIAAVPFICWFIYKGEVLWAAVLFTPAAITDWVDGKIAKERNQQTKTGKLLDPIADKLLILAPLYFLLEQGLWLGTVAIIYFREIAVTIIRFLAMNTKEEKATEVTNLARRKTVVQCICVGYAIIGGPYFNWVMLFAVFLTVLTGINYVRKIWHTRK